RGFLGTMRPSELLIRVHTHRAAVAFMGQPSVAITDARLGADVVRYSFIVVDSHHLLRVRIPGLGILQVRKRPARMGRNPATGEAIKIKASKKIAFRAAKDLKAAV